MTGRGRGFCAMPSTGLSFFRVRRASPHIIHPMQGPLKVPSLVQAVVGYPGGEVEEGIWWRQGVPSLVMVTFRG